MKNQSNTIEQNWAGEGYEDDYQAKEAADLEKETDFQLKVILEDVDVRAYIAIDAIRDYMIYECGEGDNIDFFSDLKDIISAVVHDTFANRHKPLDRFIENAMAYKAKILAEEALR